MKESILIPTMLLLLLSVMLGVGGTIVVPNDAANSEGNATAFVPFVIADQFTERYQQVYAASQFSEIPSSGAYITGLGFRPDCVLNNGGSDLTDVQIELSTTSKAPDLLSAVFAEKIGTSSSIVFGPERSQ